MILVLSTNDLLSLQQIYLYFLDKFLIFAESVCFLHDVIKYKILKV